MVLQYLKNLIQLIFAPAKGWEDIADESIDDATAASQFKYCFLPAIAICACSWFVRLLYDDTPDFWGILQSAVITFVSLFLSAEASLYILQTYMPRITVDRRFYRAGVMEMIMYSLTFLGFISFIDNVVKVHIVLIEFLPLYVIFIIWKGGRFLGVEEKNIGLFVILASASVLGSVYGVSMLLNALV